MDRVERLTNLLALLLETPTAVSLVEIMGDMGPHAYPGNLTAQRASFERDKAALREIGVPIETVTRTGVDAGTTAYWIDRDRYELTGLDLDPDETRALQMAFAAVRSGSGAGISAGEEALWKLGGARVDAGLAVTAHVPELPSLPMLRDATARRAVGLVPLPRPGARRSTRTDCSCATGSGTCSGGTTAMTSNAPIAWIASRAT